MSVFVFFGPNLLGLVASAVCSETIMLSLFFYNELANAHGQLAWVLAHRASEERKLLN